MYRKTNRKSQKLSPLSTVAESRPSVQNASSSNHTVLITEGLLHFIRFVDAKDNIQINQKIIKIK